MRNTTAFTNLSRNHTFAFPRRVTFIPIGMPDLSLKAAIDFLDWVIIGCCPAMVVRSFSAASRALALVIASPRPMFSTTFSTCGTSMTFLYPYLSHQGGYDFFLIFLPKL